MTPINSVLKALGTTHALLVNALATQYESELWPIITAHVPQPEEGSPRAIILCKDDQQARAIHAQFLPLAKPLDLTVDLIVEKGNKLQQRNDLFDGTEIIVGTARRICQMYFQNGFNVSKLRLFAVLEMDVQMRQGLKGYILRLAESLPKCKQLLLTKNTDESRIQEYVEEMIPTIQLIE